MQASAFASVPGIFDGKKHQIPDKKPLLPDDDRSDMKLMK